MRPQERPPSAAASTSHWQLTSGSCPAAPPPIALTEPEGHQPPHNCETRAKSPKLLPCTSTLSHAAAGSLETSKLPSCKACFLKAFKPVKTLLQGNHRIRLSHSQNLLTAVLCAVSWSAQMSRSRGHHLVSLGLSVQHSTESANHHTFYMAVVSLLRAKKRHS